ncbi:cyclic di-GMP binding protein [Spirochaetia bacterium]|nr:cyclic di-GMP binding protein [Spirochaetia bacterium]
MGVLPRQKINVYYDQFKNIPVTFNKEIVFVTGLQAKQVNLKCASDFYPCVIYSTSFLEAKLVANNKSGILDKLKATNNSASIKFSFKVPTSGEQVAFLVPAHVAGSAPYNGSSDMSIFTLQFSQRPPDDLIEIIGRIIEANVNFNKRKDEVITISPESLRKLKFVTKDVSITIQKVPRRCILRDISFTNARVIVLGISRLLLDKPATIKFDFSEPDESLAINGKLVNAEAMPERKEMAVLTLAFDVPVPMSYKVRISDYLTTLRVTDKGKPANQQVTTIEEKPVNIPPPTDAAI